MAPTNRTSFQHSSWLSRAPGLSRAPDWSKPWLWESCSPATQNEKNGSRIHQGVTIPGRHAQPPSSNAVRMVMGRAVSPSSSNLSRRSGRNILQGGSGIPSNLCSLQRCALSGQQALWHTACIRCRRPCRDFSFCPIGLCGTCILSEEQVLQHAACIRYKRPYRDFSFYPLGLYEACTLPNKVHRSTPPASNARSSTGTPVPIPQGLAKPASLSGKCATKTPDPAEQCRLLYIERGISGRGK